jgi:hypothetical protein
VVKLRLAGRPIPPKFAFLIPDPEKPWLEDHKEALAALKKRRRRKKPEDFFFINIIGDLSLQRDWEPVDFPPGGEEPIFMGGGETDLDVSDIKINLIVKNTLLDYYKNNE